MRLTIKHSHAHRNVLMRAAPFSFQISWLTLVKSTDHPFSIHHKNAWRIERTVDMIKSFRYLGFPFLTSHCSTVLTLPNRPMSDGLNNTAISWLSRGPKTPPAGVNENTDVAVSPSDCYRESRSTYFNKGKRVSAKSKRFLSQLMCCLRWEPKFTAVLLKQRKKTKTQPEGND